MSDETYHASKIEHDWADENCQCEECRRDRAMDDDERNERDYPDDE